MPEAIRWQLKIKKNETIFFEELNKKELELVKAGEASVNATIQELAASGHGYALKCCSDNGKETEKDGTTTHQPIKSQP